MNDEDICISKFYSAELSASGKRTHSQPGKRLSPKWQAVHLFPQMPKTAFRRDRQKAVFACWWHGPQTPFRRISFCGYAPFRRFFSHSRRRFFIKRRGWLTSMITNCPIKENGIFQKSVRLAEPQPA